LTTAAAGGKQVSVLADLCIRVHFNLDDVLVTPVSRLPVDLPSADDSFLKGDDASRLRGINGCEVEKAGTLHATGCFELGSRMLTIAAQKGCVHAEYLPFVSRLPVDLPGADNSVVKGDDASRLRGVDRREIEEAGTLSDAVKG
jgi:hypothetical protein